MLYKFFHLSNCTFFLLIFATYVFFPIKINSETILQKEKLSFDKCLEVVQTTSEKLLIEPIIEVRSEVFQTAKFVMSDGVLVINCDAKNSELKVLAE